MAKTRVDDLSVTISADASGLASDLRRATVDLNSFKKSVDSVGSTGASKLATREAMAHKAAAKEAGAAWSGVGGSAGFVRGGMIGAGIGAGLAAVKAGISSVAGAFDQARDSINLAAELEQTTLAFEVMLGSGSKAATMLGDIRKFAAETPFNNAELTDASRKLVAYGLAGDQVIPTLRMLGDVSAATQTPIGDLSYLYGTLAAQQRAYSKDIYQFANRGIPIYEALAKVLGKSVAQTKDLIEEGKVGFPEVVAAFKSMTEGKGIYAGLTSKQADTFAGVREQLSDALQLGKIKFGGILIEELGLKQATKDITAFVEGTSGGMDRLRPAVRFIGDMGRSVAQLASEFGKAAVNGGFFFGQLVEAGTMPETKKMLDDLREFLKSGKDFKLNPQAVNEMLFQMHDKLSEVMIDTLKGIKDIGQAMDVSLVQPIQKAAGEITRLYVGIKGFGGNGGPQEKYYPPQAFDSPEAIRERYREMQAAAEPVRDRYAKMSVVGPILEALPNTPANQMQRDEWEKTKRDKAAFDEAEANFLKQFAIRPEDRPGANHLLMKTDDMPRLKGQLPSVIGKDGVLEGSIKRLQQERAMANLWMAKQRDAHAAAEQLKHEQEFAAEQAKRVNDAMGALIGGAGMAARELKNVKAPPRPEVPWQVPPDVQDAAKRANDAFKKNPLDEFVEEWNNLSQGLLEGVIDRDVYNRASADLVRRTESKIDQGPYKLPDAAMQGSEAAVRILNQWQANNGQQDSRTLLSRLVDFAARQEQRDLQDRDRAKVPMLVPLPK